jgi:hypothetical protein
MANIIISYRRSDSAAIAGRIRDRLADYYGGDAIFMDIDSIPFGIDFRQQIQEAVTRNDILLALIGPRWIGARKAGTRISDDKDPIRIEIETALDQRKPLIPVLVGGATMPKSSALPESLQRLCFLNAAEVDDGRDFHQHVDRLIRAMDRLLTEAKLGGLAQKSKSHPIRDVAAPLPLRADVAAPKESVSENRIVSDASVAKSSAAFSAFFCAQTTTMARVAVLVGAGGWALTGAADLANEKLMPAMNAYRGLIVIPVGFAFFAASYMSLAQRYWQTFLSAICVISTLVTFSAVWVSYQTEQPFDLEKWCIVVLAGLTTLALVPLRFLNVVGINVFVGGLTYLFLILTNQPLLSTAWMQAEFAVALFVVCAIGYFREKHLWQLFQSTEAQRAARANTTN